MPIRGQGRGTGAQVATMGHQQRWATVAAAPEPPIRTETGRWVPMSKRRVALAKQGASRTGKDWCGRHDRPAMRLPADAMREPTADRKAAKGESRTDGRWHGCPGPVHAESAAEAEEEGGDQRCSRRPVGRDPIQAGSGDRPGRRSTPRGRMRRDDPRQPAGQPIVPDGSRSVNRQRA